MSEDRAAVYVSKDLYNLVKRRVEESGGEFKSVEDYAEFVLREFVKEECEGETYTPEEEEKKKAEKFSYP